MSKALNSTGTTLDAITISSTTECKTDASGVPTQYCWDDGVLPTDVLFEYLMNGDVATGIRVADVGWEEPPYDVYRGVLPKFWRSSSSTTQVRLQENYDDIESITAGAILVTVDSNGEYAKVVGSATDDLGMPIPVIEFDICFALLFDLDQGASDDLVLMYGGDGVDSTGSGWWLGGSWMTVEYGEGLFDCDGGRVRSTRALPGNYGFSAPLLPIVLTASKGSKNSINLGNSGFAPVGNGMMIGVGYDRADNSVSNNSDANFDGNEYRIHLDLLKGHNNLFYGLAGEYRESKYTLADLTTKYKTKYYGPRVDLGYRGMDSWAQISGGYYFGNAYVEKEGESDYTKFSNGYLAQLGLLAQMDKWLSNRFSLKPGVDVQYIWQKLGTIDEDKFKNRDYGRADFNLGLGIALVRGWDVTPNVGYRWDIKSACTQTDSSDKICEPTASGVRYGVQLAKAVMVTGSKWDQLAVSAYYDYFKKSGVKQSVWGVMAQYPF